MDQNAKEKAKVQRIQAENSDDADTDSSASSRQRGEISGDKPLRANRANSTKFRAANYIDIFGKILRQLREIREAHLAYVNAHTERLRARLTEDEEYRQKIAENMDRLEQEIMTQLDNSQKLVSDNEESGGKSEEEEE